MGESRYNIVYFEEGSCEAPLERRIGADMRVFHPPQVTNGIPPENFFLIADSANVTVAEGFLIHTYHPYLFAERPINMYLSLRSKGPGLRRPR